MKNLKKISNIVPLPIVFFFVVTLGIVFCSCLIFVRFQMFSTLKQVSSSHKYFISSFILESEDGVKSNRITKEKARKMLLDSFDNYNKSSGQDDFLNVFDSKGNAILLINPEDIGKNYRDFKYESIRNAYEKIFKFVEAKGSGYIEYSFIEPKGNAHFVQRRFAYFETIPQYDLVVICSISANHVVNTILGLSFLLFAIIAFVFALSIGLVLRLRYNSLRAMVESSPFPVWVKNRNSKILVVNQAYKNMKMVDAENIVDKESLLKYAPKEEAMKVIGSFESVLKTGIMTVDEFHYDLYGKVSLYMIFQVPIFDILGNVKYVAALVCDISSKEEVQKQKLEFISMISHELRTPLTALIGSIQLVNTIFKTAIPENVLQLSIVQERNALNLKYLIDNILDSSKLDANKMQFDITNNNVVPIVELTAKNLETYATTYNVSLNVEKTDDEIRINIDKDRYTMCLSNMISNAIKYSKSGATVDICVSKTEDNKAKISVKNYDAYIPPEKINLVFGRFDQVDNKDQRAKKGTGLGMYITKQLVDKMNGQIDIASDEHVTEFYTIFDIVENIPTEENSEEN